MLTRTFDGLLRQRTIDGAGGRNVQLRKGGNTMAETEMSTSLVTHSRPKFQQADGMGREMSTTRVMPKILLASRSPRRREFLALAGIEHDAEHPGVEDSVLECGNVSPEAWVTALAYLKARAGAELVRGQRRLVIGADTSCVLDGKLVGTPRDRDEARRMIASFVGRSHDVVTGVALLDSESGERVLFHDRASVVFGQLAGEAIDQYIESDRWVGKAGGYNLAERVEAGWPIVSGGDPTTIMGLPMAKLNQHLAAWKSRLA